MRNAKIAQPDRVTTMSQCCGARRTMRSPGASSVSV